MLERQVEQDRGGTSVAKDSQVVDTVMGRGHSRSARLDELIERLERQREFM